MAKFGMFLVSHKKATKEQINNAIKWQRNIHKPLSHIALEQKMLTINEIILIFDDQAKTNGEFGITAVNLGYLTDSQFQQLSKLQMESRPKLGEILIEMGIIDHEILSEMLYAFYKKNERPQNQATAVEAVL